MNQKKDDIKLVGYLEGGAKKHLSGRIITTGGVCFTLMAMTHGWGQGYIMEENEDQEE